MLVCGKNGSDSEPACTCIRGEMAGAGYFDQAREESIVVRSSTYCALITGACSALHAALRAVSIRKCSMVRTADSVCDLALRTPLFICVDWGAPGGGDVFSVLFCPGRVNATGKG